MGAGAPLAGIRVLELGVWVAAPACTSLLADWGADVIKLEPPTGDPLRGVIVPGVVNGVHPWFETINRGKRSVALDLRTAAGRTIADQLLSEADVFITNLLLPAVGRLELDPDTVRAAYPRIVYCRMTAYGAQGIDATRRAFDQGGFWARSGFLAPTIREGTDPQLQRAGLGDHSTGLAAAAAIAAALVKRERTGEGSLVDISLYRAGTFLNSWDLIGSLHGTPAYPHRSRKETNNPLQGIYRAGDGRYFLLTNLTPDVYWPGVCAAIERLDLLADPRFADLSGRAAHAAELIDILDAVFLTRSRAEWSVRFAEYGVIWAEAMTSGEIIEDPQAAINHAWIDAIDSRGLHVRMPAGPADFDGINSEVTASGPEVGAHTEQVLLELGYSWQQLGELKEAGVIP